MRLPLLSGVIMMLCGAAAQAAPPAAPVLEAASVKLATSAEIDDLRGRGIAPSASFSGNRATVSALSLISIIRAAYNVRVSQISGEPKWIDENNYDIAAKAEGDVVLDAERFRQLLQAVLSDRFHLRVHREKLERPIYALIVGGKGPMLKESSGNGTFSMKAGKSLIEVSGGSMTQLAATLTANVDRPVFDQTGLAGKYDFKLQFAPSSLSATPDSSVEPNGFPSLFTAVQEQLGLRLKATTGPIEMLVIDHIEQPTSN